jgi:urease accessory protein
MTSSAAGHAERSATRSATRACATADASSAPSDVAFARETLALVRLLQLASPTLPVGAFSYSQGLEWAVQAGLVVDARSAGEWISDSLALGFGRCEAPVLVRLLVGWRTNDGEGLRRWNGWFRASRDTAESRAETIAMGQALCRLSRQLDVATQGDRVCMDRCAPVTLPLVYALVAARWAIPSEAAVAAYAWAWTENQVMAATRCVPLGQAAAQRLLHRLGGMIPELCTHALAVGDEGLSSFAPGLAIASCRHEVQYTRLFRS